MTETSILPVSSDNAQPPGDHQDSEDGGAAGANRRKLLIAGGVAGVAVLAVAAFMLLHGGSSSATPGAAVVPHGTVKPAVSAQPTSAGSGKKTTLPKKSKVQAGRNPFIPLFAAPVTGDTAVGGTTTVTSVPSTGTTAPPVVGSSPAPTPTSPPVGALGAPKYIELLSTKGTRSATFRVGYAHHKFKQFAVSAPAAGASTGTVFATDFALIQVRSSGVPHQGIATIQIGDDAPFDISGGVSRPL
jgi:hypothetical protein